MNVNTRLAPFPDVTGLGRDGPDAHRMNRKRQKRRGNHLERCHDSLHDLPMATLSLSLSLLRKKKSLMTGMNLLTSSKRGLF